MDCSPVVLSSLNTGAKYSSPPGLGERQRLEHRLRLVFGLPELARRVRVGYDARAGLHDDPVRAHERSEEHTSELQSLAYLVCRLLLEKKKKTNNSTHIAPRVYTNTHSCVCTRARSD